jgi:hypothetical protein
LPDHMTDHLLKPGEQPIAYPHRGLGPNPIDRDGYPTTPLPGVGSPGHDLPPVAPGPLPDRDAPYGEASPQIVRRPCQKGLMP